MGLLAAHGLVAARLHVDYLAQEAPQAEQAVRLVVDQQNALLAVALDLGHLLKNGCNVGGARLRVSQVT